VVAALGHGRRPGWRKFAEAKQREIEDEMKRLAVTRHILTKLAACRCATLEDCGRLFSAARAKESIDSPLKLTTRRRLRW
jgi:hypothetical protein